MQDLNQLQAYLRQYTKEHDWVQLPEHINTTQGMFVTRVVGESMNKRIINGS